MNNIKNIALLFLSAILLIRCSAERNNPLSKAYHNTTARYNAYFLANEKMKAVEEEIRKEMKYDYNQILDIFPEANEKTVATISPDLEEVIKKASLPIQRHKNSHLVDDSYLLIGKARYYKEEYDEAIQTFKYVNTTSKDDAARHQSLIWLMRSFIKTKEYSNVAMVADFLRKEKLNKTNSKDLYITKACYYSLAGDKQRVIQNLNLALPLVEKKDERLRLRFILAQLYQEKNQDKKAYEQYSKILRKNPPYELGFYSKLNIGQVTELSKTSDKEKVEKYYKKLLKDIKNVEYRDKIYYEMARFELKQGKQEKAIPLLNQSVRSSIKDSPQKAYSYLLLGKIYFENLQKYKLAQVYYDSTLQVLSKNAPNYEAIQERRDILNEFVTHYETIEREDSLQYLAKLSKPALDEKLESLAKEEIKRRIAALEKKEAKPGKDDGRKLQPKGDFPDFADQMGSGATWYFDNPATLATAKQEFIKNWGNRSLQDNWRKSSQLALGVESGEEKGLPEEKKETLDQEKLLVELKAQYLKDIPLDQQRFSISEKLVEDALYNLANIYNFQLQETEKAAETYDKLINRFPDSEYTAEVLYSLYLIYDRKEDDKKHNYASRLKKEFPKTKFAKLVERPEYATLTSQENLLAHKLYDSAFVFYSDKKYKESLALSTEILAKFPGTDINDKVAYLSVLNIARMKGPAEYKAALEQFIQNYPASSLQGRAQEAMLIIENFEKGQLSGTSESKKTGATGPEVEYFTDMNSPHFFVVAYPRGNPDYSKIPDKYSDYNMQFHSSDNLSLNTYIYGDDLELIIIKEFANAKKAMAYHDKQRSEKSPLAKIAAPEYKTFIISRENFPIFFKAKDLDSYMNFFRKKY